MVTKTIENETEEQKSRFLGMILGTLGVGLLGNMLEGKSVIRAGHGVIRAEQDFQPSHPLLQT